MRTLALLSLLLAVALGIPLDLEQKEEQVPPPKTLQHPLVGDLLPVQGHVVEENPAPQPELGKELHLSVLSPDKKESLQVQEDISVNEVGEEPQVMQDLKEVNNEIKNVESATPLEEVSLDSEFTENHIEVLQADQEPKAEIINGIAVEEEKEPIQELENYSGIEGKYDFEQPMMELEPLTDKETQRDTVEDEDHSVTKEKYNFEQPIMKLEPLTDEETQRDTVEDEDHSATKEKYNFEQPVMKLEPLTNEEMQKDTVKDEDHSDIEEKYNFEQPIMKLEPLTNEEMQKDTVENEDHSDIEEKYNFEQPIMKLEPLTDEEMQKDTVKDEDHSATKEKYNFEQPIMKLEPLTDEEMQRDELLEVSNTKGVYEEPIMYVEPEAAEGQFMNEMNLPDAGTAMEEEGPMLDALGQPLQLTDEYLPHDEGFMRLEPLESEDHSQMLLSVEPVVHGLRSCSGVVLEGKCFQFFTNPKKASEAEYFCQQSFRGGHLASITCPNVHNEMMNLMRRNGGTRRTWVGGLRFLDTGRFVWLDGSHWGYADWLLGEPNNTANLEDCIELLASGKFNDFTCWEPQAFICSYPY